MSAVHDPTADLTTVVHQLEALAAELRGLYGWRVPEVIAACESLTCAAVLLRTQQDSTNGNPAHLDLLHDAVALARSAVEATKYAARERFHA